MRVFSRISPILSFACLALANMAPHAHARQVSVSWEELEGAVSYELRVLKGKEQLVTKKLDDVEWKTDLPPGEYQFQLRGYDRFKRPGEWSAKQALTVPLAAPKLRSPAANQEISRQQNIELSWDAVEGAEAYEVTFVLRGPAGKKTRHKPNVAYKKRLPANKTDLNLSWADAGKYEWKVRALASAVPVETTAEAASSFEISPRNPYVGMSGYVALSGLLSPYQYRSERQIGGYQPSHSATSSIARLSGEYWLGSAFGVGGAVERAFLGMDNKRFGLTSGYVVAKTRTALDPPNSSWYLAVEVGLERRQYLELIVDSTVMSTNPEFHGDTVSSVGPHLGVEVRKQLTKSLTLSNKLLAFMPMTFSASEVSGKVRGEPSLHNISLGSQLAYWTSPTMGVALGAFLDRRSLSYTKTSNGSQNTIQMNAIYGFGSLILLIP